MALAATALEFLSARQPPPATRIVVAFGDEPYLIALVRQRLRALLLSGEDAQLSESSRDGASASWIDVNDELSTVALFGGGARLVIVNAADDFVSRHRAALEQWVDRPRGSGTLVLEPASWPSNTRLAKAVAQHGWTIDCKAPAPARLGKWLTARAQETHGVRLEGEAAELLLEIVGPELGLLDQELAKLAAATAQAGSISATLVRELVGGWRVQTAWEMLDAALDGRTATALGQLDRLLTSGENEVALLAQISSSLRRLAAAARLVTEAEQLGQRTSLRTALEQAGVRSFVLARSEGQLKQLGRQRAGQLYRWLIDADLDLKGGSRVSARLVLERLLARMAPAADPRQANGASGSSSQSLASASLRR